MANIGITIDMGEVGLKNKGMKSTLNLSLTDELRALIDENSEDGTLYATPSEFVRD